MLLPGAVRLAEPALPVRVVAVIAPAGWVVAPVAFRLTVGAPTAPSRVRSPVTVRPILVWSVTGPATVKACASFRENPVCVVKPASVPIRLPLTSNAEFAVPVSVPTVSEPPSPIAPPLRRSSVAAMPVRSIASVALPMLIGPATAEPSCSVPVRMTPSRAASIDRSPGLAAPLAITSIGRPGDSGAMAMVPPGASKAGPPRPMKANRSKVSPIA